MINLFSDMRKGARMRMAVLLLLLLTALCGAACAQTEYKNPLISPKEIEYVQTEHSYLNILLAGIDFGHSGYWGSYGKNELEECHADAMMVISLDLDDGGVNLISLPRDSVTYVPGVQGIYKLNGAVNCGDTMEQGLERACAAASWLLGGVEVSWYFAVDMNTMITLGDAIGGVDFDMDMTYTGHSGTRYYTGMQHLDGMGIMDYLRARKNATRGGNDIGRTGRQRELMLAIFNKIKENPALIAEVIKVLQDPEQTLLTNVGLADVFSLAAKAISIDTRQIGSYVLTGSYGMALESWNFTFTDQENRQKVIKETFGLDVEPIPYVKKKYCDWLVESGFTTVRYIGSARTLLDYAAQMELTQEQQALVTAFENQLDAVCLSFDAAADSMSTGDNNAMLKARRELRVQGEALVGKIDFPEMIDWSEGTAWYLDPRINEYQYKWQ